MKRKEYKKPTMQVVKLQHLRQILAGSPLNNHDDYPDGGDPFNF